MNNPLTQIVGRRLAPALAARPYIPKEMSCIAQNNDLKGI